MAKSPHFHKYEKFTWPGGRSYYKCMQPGCPHYLPVMSLAIGRESICWGDCGRLVLITKEDVHNEIKKPLCDECKKERADRKRELSELGRTI